MAPIPQPEAHGDGSQTAVPAIDYRRRSKSGYWRSRSSNTDWLGVSFCEMATAKTMSDDGTNASVSTKSSSFRFCDMVISPPRSFRFQPVEALARTCDLGAGDRAAVFTMI